MKTSKLKKTLLRILIFTLLHKMYGIHVAKMLPIKKKCFQSLSDPRFSFFKQL